MPLFGKNKKKKGESDEAELEILDKAENDKSEVKVKKKSAFSSIKKKFRLILKVKPNGKKSSDEDDSEHEQDDEPDDGEVGKKSKTKKPKKEKKPKEKKEKKPKNKKPKKSKNSEDSQDGEGKNKIKPVIWIIIAAGALAVGVAAFLIVTFVVNKPTVEKQLLDAQLLFNEQKYSDADKIYEKLLKKDPALVKAHLGHADVLVANEQTDAAVESLNAALEPTGNDPEIQKKIDELSPPPENLDENGNIIASPGTTAVIVSFSDPAFDKMIRLALKISPYEQITSSDLETITSLKIMGNTHAVADPFKSRAATGGGTEAVERNIPSINRTDSYEIDGVVYTERGAIKNLDDLKYFTGLKKLIVAYNSVVDINGISQLKSLETLGLYCNDIVDISPLSSLSSLKYLYVYNNHIRDISPLSTLTELKQLWLNKNNISDISALKDHNELTELFLNDNEIKDISAVANLKKIGFLYFNNNQVSDISAVKDLDTLTDISFVGNPITDTSPASHISHINMSLY